MDTGVAAALDQYPTTAQKTFLQLRELVFEVANEESIEKLEETLKWGEPAYLSPQGSTLRISWKEKSPETISLYFNCNTKLVETIRQIYETSLRCIGNREVVLSVSNPLPVEELKTCISLCLRYHKIKHLHLLGL